MLFQNYKVINLALQGGGSHGAFTWGVLDRLLADSRLRIEGISGASSGALNAAVLASGYTRDGAAGARAALRTFWECIGTDFTQVFYPPLHTPLLSLLHDNGQGPVDAYLALSEIFSPQYLNPLDINPLRDLISTSIDFELLRRDCPVRLFIATTRVRTGKLRIFENHELNVDALMASACLPSLHHTVRIGDDHYWDGGLSGNPPVFPLIFKCEQRDIIVVMLHPLDTGAIPDSAEKVRQRVVELGFNTAFLREMRAIAFSKKIIADNWLVTGKLESRMRNINIHLIEDQALFAQYDARSRYNTLPSFIELLYREGYAAAEVWLETNYDLIGRKSSVDLVEIFC